MLPALSRGCGSGIGEHEGEWYLGTMWSQSSMLYTMTRDLCPPCWLECKTLGCKHLETIKTIFNWLIALCGTLIMHREEQLPGSLCITAPSSCQFSSLPRNLIQGHPGSLRDLGKEENSLNFKTGRRADREVKEAWHLLHH